MIDNEKFVDNLVLNINKGLNKEINKTAKNQNQEICSTTEQSLQAQLDECMQNIIGSTLSDPTFDEVLDDVVQQSKCN